MLHTSIAASLDSLSEVSRFAQEAAAAAGLASASAYRLRLALVELVTNTISYGFEGATSPPPIDLLAEMDDRTLTVTIEDAGMPFDPTTAEPPPTASFDERKLGGYGVFLALTGVDRFRYERAGNRNRNVLSINRPTVSSANA
jgi:serine/threonine-protein kinase RsbW